MGVAVFASVCVCNCVCVCVPLSSPPIRFPLGELQLAWDFVTVSRGNSLGRVESARDVALNAVGIEGPQYTISRVEEEHCDAAYAHTHVLALAALVMLAANHCCIDLLCLWIVCVSVRVRLSLVCLCVFLGVTA